MMCRSGVGRCARGACGAVGEAGGAARKSLGRRRSRAGMSRFDDVNAPRRSPERSGSPRFDTSAAQFPFRYHARMIDPLIIGFDRALRTLSGNVQPTRIAPGLTLPEPE